MHRNFKIYFIFITTAVSWFATTEGMLTYAAIATRFERLNPSLLGAHLLAQPL